MVGSHVLRDLGGEARTEPGVAARGLREGGRVQIAGGTVQREITGKTGTLLRYNSATVEVEGRRYASESGDWNPLGT